jgi:molecular chaperone DnaK
MRGIPKIEVTFDIDANGIIKVSAKDQGTGKVQNIKIESGSKLSDEEIQKMRDDAAANEEADKMRLRKSQVSNNADALCFQMEKTIEDLGDKVSEADKADIRSKIEEVRKIKDLDDVDATEAKLDELVKKMNDISSSIYSSAQTEAPQTDSEPEAEKTEDLQDVEYEEVQK